VEGGGSDTCSLSLLTLLCRTEGCHHESQQLDRVAPSHVARILESRRPRMQLMPRLRYKGPLALSTAARDRAGSTEQRRSTRTGKQRYVHEPVRYSSKEDKP